jgi:hypothetical protein
MTRYGLALKTPTQLDKIETSITRKLKGALMDGMRSSGY